MVAELRTHELGDARCRIQAIGLFKDEDAKDYAPNPESEHLRIQVPSYEGPLDLLLHLIQKHSIDIFDIPIALITEEYLEEVQNLELDLAGEFLLMAATLLQIKSKMLLPKEEQPADLEEEGLDPRAELVRRLLEYQRYKEVAEGLRARDYLGFNIFGRIQAEPEGEPSDDEEQKIAPIEAFELIENFARIVESMQPKIGHTVSFEPVSLRARLMEMIDFSRMKLQFWFKEAVGYFGARTKSDVIVSFLSILEMARLRLVRIEQEPGSSHISIIALDHEFAGELGDVEL